MRSVLQTGMLLGGILACAAAIAQPAYPAQPVTLVVPFAAGSGADIVARSLGKHLGDVWKVPVIVDNKPGANGAIGAQAVARAKPDGYTLLVGSATTNAANYAFYAAKLGYSAHSFEIAGGMTGTALALHVPTGSPWKTVGDLVAAAKSGKGAPPLMCGSGNALTQVACEIFKKQAGIDLTTIPYRSNPMALTDLIGGQISFAFSDTAVSQVLVQGGKLRLLAVAGTQRNPAYPKVPTFTEQGIPNMLLGAWTALYAPAGTPLAVLEKLNAEVNRWIDSPDAAQILAKSGSVALRMDLAAAQRFSTSEITRWAQYIKESNVQPE